VVPGEWPSRDSGDDLSGVHARHSEPGGAKPGAVNADLVPNINFAETFLEAAGLKVPEGMRGRRLVPLL
jgi:hypothetical protein